MTTEEMLTKKRAQQAALRDTPEDATLHAAIGRDMSALISAPPEIADCNRVARQVERWIADCQRWHGEFKKELDQLPPLHERSHEQGQRGAALTEAINQIETGVRFVHGAALLSPLLREKICATYPPSWDMLPPLDPWRVGFGSVREAHAKLDEVQRKRAAAQARLDDGTRRSGYGLRGGEDFLPARHGNVLAYMPVGNGRRQRLVVPLRRPVYRWAGRVIKCRESRPTFLWPRAVGQRQLGAGHRLPGTGHPPKSHRFNVLVLWRLESS